jgi:hypothetical protein
MLKIYIKNKIKKQKLDKVVEFKLLKQKNFT